jgi:hypothetical protein
MKMTLEAEVLALVHLVPTGVDLLWDFADPFVVTLEALGSGWLLERDLLVRALAEPVEAPRWSSTPGSYVRLVLGEHELDLPRKPLAAYLGQLVKAVPLGTELEHLDPLRFV